MKAATENVVHILIADEPAGVDNLELQYPDDIDTQKLADS